MSMQQSVQTRGSMHDCRGEISNSRVVEATRENEVRETLGSDPQIRKATDRSGGENDTADAGKSRVQLRKGMG